tara:strand:- start:148 stop:813 length:666 start_codon:yes stop_codon:yes gene_type:complete
MECLTHQLLDKKSAKNLCSKLLAEKSQWIDGKSTAGSHAAKTKKNLQLDRNSKTSQECSEEIIQLLESDLLIKSFCLPREFHSLMFTLSRESEGYGMHIDNTYMSTGRSDLSFTLFLNEPDEYHGGELCIQSVQEQRNFKLNSGEIIIYPSTSLHAVNTVSKGQRIVCVGWIQSYIASNEDRYTLFGLDAGARGLLAEHGQSQQLDLVFQSYNNLLRRLGD